MIEHFFTCPYCWQEISFIIDSSLPYQDYVEDCEVCCRPIKVVVEISEGRVSMFSGEKTE